LACSSVKGDAKLADRYAARAVELLRQAAARGYENVDRFKSESDFDSLRNRDDYRKLLADLEEKAKGRK
jgi:hypothetical protein